jgi:hypothetical protein
LQLDGVKTDKDRGVEVCNLVADFGFPANIDDISVKNVNEFDPTGDITRNIACLDMSQPENALRSTPAEYEPGAMFQPSKALFEPEALSFASEEIVPPLPFFLQPARTSFRSQNNLSTLRSELEAAFAKCSVAFVQLETACGYSCSALRQSTVIKIDVNIFESDSDLLVELRQVSGCRYAYSEVTSLLAEALQVAFAECMNCLPPCPPELTEEELANMPELKKTPSADSKCDDEVRTSEYAMQLIGEDVPRSTLVQGLRAVSTIIDSMSSTENTCALCGACGADHCNHESMFAKGGHGVRLAQRVAELAGSSDEDVRSVAMAAVANIASLDNVCSKWMNQTIPTLVAGAQDDEPHVRREALRSIEALASKSEKMAAKLVRAGAVPTLELEANGGEDHQSPDLAMQAYAEGALAACRGE